MKITTVTINSYLSDRKNTALSLGHASVNIPATKTLYHIKLNNTKTKHHRKFLDV